MKVARTALFLITGVFFSLPNLNAATTHGPLLVGLASQDVTPYTGVPLAGYSGKRRLKHPDLFGKYKYAFFLKPSQGVLDPIRSQVMYLNKGDSRLVFINLDVVGVSADMRQDLFKRLKNLHLSDDELFIMATHTHSGPGDMAKAWFWQIFATDRFHKAVYKRFLDGIVLSVYKAISNAEPADLYRYSFDAVGLQENRRGHVGHFDPETHLLLAKRKDGSWMGGMVNVAVHGTSLGPENLKFSGDLPGAIKTKLELRFEQENTGDTRPVHMLFSNGAEGDVAPAENGMNGVQNLSDHFTDQAIHYLGRAEMIDPNWSVLKSTLKIGHLHVNLRACAHMKKPGKLPTLPPEEHSEINHGGKQTEVWVISIGDFAIMTWPGEPTTSLGFELKDLARKAGAKKPWVMALTNDHLSYFVTPEESLEGGYESCMMFYGEHAGQTIVSGIAGLLNQNAQFYSARRELAQDRQFLRESHSDLK